jgi:hypothetical protein
MIRPLGAVALAILTLSACAFIESTIERFFPLEQMVALSDPNANLELAQMPAPPMPRRKPEVISELTLVDADPQQLVGLDFNGAKALLGDPAVQIEQPPAKVWAYAGGGCKFSVFFYPSVDGEIFRVLAFEVTDEADILGLRWLSDPPDAPPRPPKVLDRGDPIVRRCFAELLHHRELNAG